MSFSNSISSIIEMGNFDKFIEKFEGSYYRLTEQLIEYNSKKVIKKFVKMMLSYPVFKVNFEDEELRNKVNELLCKKSIEISKLDKDYSQHSSKMHTEFNETFPYITGRQLKELNAQLSEIDRYLRTLSNLENVKEDFCLEAHLTKIFKNCKTDLETYDCIRCLVDNLSSLKVESIIKDMKIEIPTKVNDHMQKYILLE